ncbi:2-oxoglutarate dehydrogenase E1 component [Sneathiella chinensis]|uniref:2-oxoglutarate dehydrogenase E1 component n=1 Tax=Sneathiella chinensis TaxID=349750 RepID=A0ABQ5U9D4_9PROT|nr:2-oxoglutarate dehydrogenase E1 component [Sneathiella chinensis]GLQ07854.1 2-oxoglutarate dehydrogenase subunit E1 [Sneathiella chinensis]
MSQTLDNSSFLTGSNAGFIEELYARYLNDPSSVDSSWQQYFQTLGDDAETIVAQNQGAPWTPVNGIQPEDEYGILGDAAYRAIEVAETKGLPLQDVRAAAVDTIRALMLIRSYRVRGHLKAHLDPLGLEIPKEHPELDPASYGFAPEDWDREIFIDNVLGLETATIREILDIVKRTYCGSIGVEFMHIQEPDQKAWIQERIEGRHKEVTFTPEGKIAILRKLIETEGFEQFLNVKYTGTKRFGLDGGEAMVPAMEGIIKRGGQLGVKEIVLGMPHRGRLNVLTNVMAKPFRAVFSEFQGNPANPEDVEGSGDVKYHLGTSSDREFDGNNVHLSLTANPSHLEAVNPVVLGKARAKQAQIGSDVGGQVMPLLLHGDAAFAGQGIVAECFGLSELKGYRTSGTIHFVVNNQIGFTTSPKYSRSSPYPSDVGKMVQAPIFHVNGDDPEAVCHVAKIATEFRQQFQIDVVIDMFCYRRHGHNEGDEPAFTQPLMYRTIAQHPTTMQIYAKKLIAEGVATEQQIEGWVKEFRDYLEKQFETANSFKPNKADWFEGRWQGFERADQGARRGATAVPIDELKAIGEKLTNVPEGHNVHRTLQRVLKNKKKMFDTGENIDWATAEALAFGSLLKEEYPVRLSGQDCGRGTFSQRHSVIVDQVTEERYIPLNNLGEQQAQYEVIDSLLSEAAVLGYEYGYSLAEPKALVLWEAQFGDFANGAQVIIDQFISSGEAKWLRMSGLVMLLPHGYEGQGPEHSSARLERYLQMSAEDNWQVVNCTTPANYFHVLRRQIHRKFRKPLVVMTPKSLLRHKMAVSTLEEMGPGSSFHRVLYDNDKVCEDKDVRRVVICSGKVYYDLRQRRDELGLTDTFFLRLEQLYPFPDEALSDELKRFTHVEEVVWCQEEPKNMGAWTFVEPHLEEVFAAIGMKNVTRARYAGRAAAAATATGLLKKHNQQQSALVDDALGIKAE